MEANSLVFSCPDPIILILTSQDFQIKDGQTKHSSRANAANSTHKPLSGQENQDGLNRVATHKPSSGLENRNYQNEKKRKV